MKTLAALMIVGAFFGSAPIALAQVTDPDPALFVSVRGMRTDHFAHRRAGIQRVTKPGDVATTYLLAGRLEDPDGTLCTTRGMSATAPMPTPLDNKALAMAAYVWKVTTTVLTYEAGRLTVDVDWQRFDRGANTPGLSRKQQVVLQEGESYPLDLVLGKTSACPAAIVEVTASVREDPAFADTVLRYDLWLVRSDKTGRKETRQLILSGVHGDPVDFQFAPLVSPVPRLQPDQYDFSVVTRVRGSVRGRVTADGRVSLVLETSRRNQLERPSKESAPQLPPDPRSLAQGRKVLTGVLGEAIEIELPPANGYTSTYVSAKAEADAKERRRSRNPDGTRASDGKIDRAEAIAIRDGRLAVNYGPLLAGERLSLIVQVKKAEGADEQPLAKK